MKNDPDRDFILEFLDTPERTQYIKIIPAAISSCCQLKLEHKVWLWSEEKELREIHKLQSMSPGLSHETDFTWDGAMVFVEYELVIPTILNIVVVHSLTQLDNDSNGILHAVAGPEVGVRLCAKEIVPPCHNCP